MDKKEKKLDINYTLFNKNNIYLRIIVGFIISIISMFWIYDFNGQLSFGFGFGFGLFPLYWLIKSKDIKDSEEVISGETVMDGIKYILVKKYGIFSYTIIGGIIAIFGAMFATNFIGAFILGFGLSIIPPFYFKNKKLLVKS